MKKLILSILVFSGIYAVNAQVTYSIIPAKSLTVTAASNSITIFDIFEKNIGAAKIVMKWKGISINLPGTWNYSMCDFGTCYPGIPNGPNTMDTIPVNGQGFLGLNIDPGTQAGTGIVKVYVYQNGYPLNGDTLTWTINSVASGLFEQFAGNNFQIFPNPVKNNLNIKLANGFNEKAIANIMDALGRNVMTVELASADNQIDISGLQNGCYSLVIKSGQQQFVKRIIKAD